MKQSFKAFWRGRIGLTAAVGVAACLALWSVGCDGDDTEDYDDYEPPAGMGALVVDNNTFTEVDVFIDGGEMGRVDDYDYAVYDRQPGVYRVVLDERDGNRLSALDVDVLEGRRTVLDLSLDSDNSSRYTVTIRVDD
jgi:hypothetical protein